MKKIWLDNYQPNWDYIVTLDWFQSMQDCPQDPTFHAEGNVGIHTKMVVNELLQSTEFQALEEESKSNLAWAALLHDVAKPICTRTDEEGYIRAPKHAKIGEQVARDMLWAMPLEKREQICALIRLHGLPIWCLDKPNPNLAAYWASLRLKNEHLYLLARSDVRGRISVGQDDFLERIELYQLFCKEQACWQQPKQFANAHSQFKYFQKQETYPSTLFDDTQFEVTIMVGMPGSGKDTIAATLDLPIVSLDAIRTQHKIKPTDKKAQGKVAQLAYEQAKQYAIQKQSFVWNSTNLTAEMRQKITNKLAPYNPYFKIIYVETSKQNILQRRQAIIPIKTLEKMFRVLEIPTASEGHEVIWERN